MQILFHFFSLINAYWLVCCFYAIFMKMIAILLLYIKLTQKLDICIKRVIFKNLFSNKHIPSLIWLMIWFMIMVVGYLPIWQIMRSMFKNSTLLSFLFNTYITLINFGINQWICCFHLSINASLRHYRAVTFSWIQFDLHSI